MCVHLRSFWVWLRVTETFAHRCACVFWDFVNAPPSSAPFLHQFMMQFLFRVMKYTWLLPPERTDAKNTCRTTRVSGLQCRWHSWVQLLSVKRSVLPYHFSHRGTSASELFCAWRRHQGGRSPPIWSQWPSLPIPWSDWSRCELWGKRDVKMFKSHQYIFFPHCCIFFVHRNESYQQKWASRPTAGPRP